MHKHDTEIETKIHEETKPIAEVLEKMSDEFASSIDNTKPEDLCAAGAITDMIKDLAEAKEKIVKACYYKAILCKMEEEEREEEEEDRYMLKRFKEEYGEEDGERRYYDNYRYANGRFAPKGRGSYEPRRSGRRRGYEEPPYYHVMPEDYEDYNAEKMRDLDRHMGRMYYTNGGGSYRSNSGGSSRGMNAGGNSGNTSGGSRGYSDGYDEGNRRGYEDGYRDGERSGRSKGGSGSMSRYDRARRGYEEAKEMHKGNTPEDKQMTMKEAEKFVNVILDELEDALSDASPEVKNMVKSKTVGKMQKMN